MGGARQYRLLCAQILLLVTQNDSRAFVNREANEYVQLSEACCEPDCMEVDELWQALQFLVCNRSVAEVELAERGHVTKTVEERGTRNTEIVFTHGC